MRRGVSGWVSTGVLRGAAAGGLTSMAVILVATAVALRPRAPLPAGTTTTSTQTLSQGLAGLFFVALLVGLVVQCGVVVGTLVGVVAGAVAAGIDAATRRSLTPTSIAAFVVVGAWAAAEIVAWLVVSARAATRTVELAVIAGSGLPFVIALVGLVVRPLRRASQIPQPTHPGP